MPISPHPTPFGAVALSQRERGENLKKRMGLAISPAPFSFSEEL
jgi:hypothetical protein